MPELTGLQGRSLSPRRLQLSTCGINALQRNHGAGHQVLQYLVANHLGQRTIRTNSGETRNRISGHHLHTQYVQDSQSRMNMPADPR